MINDIKAYKERKRLDDDYEVLLREGVLPAKKLVNLQHEIDSDIAANAMSSEQIKKIDEEILSWKN